MNAVAKYQRRVDRVDSLLCVGLDCAIARIPQRFRDQATPQFAFNRYIIEHTHAYVSAYKPNSAFYEARGAQGLQELQLTLDYLREQHPDILTICDAKRGDNATTNQAYAAAIFDQLGFDAVTLQPYMGRQVLAPFLERTDKGCIVLCRTSNPGDAELQELLIAGGRPGADKPLWQVVAEKVRDEWNAHGNCMLVVGATQPDSLRKLRQLIGAMPILAPGLGEQGADIQAAVEAGVTAAGSGMILSASRSVIFSDDPAREAKSLRDEINASRRLVAARAR